MFKGREKLEYVKAKNYKSSQLGEIYNQKGVKLLCTNRHGYKTFNVRINGQTKSISVHRFIAYEKYGDLLFMSECVRHKDGNSLNNNWDNLILGSHSENMMDKSPHIRISRAIYASSFMSKYPHKEIINYRKTGATYSQIMEKFKINSKGTVSFIIKKSRHLLDVGT